MSEGDWVRLIGDRPTLIMLDELPPYLAMAHTKTIGQGTLLDLLKYSIANLFSAAMKLKRCVVVVASLDAAYDEARRILGGQLAKLPWPAATLISNILGIIALTWIVMPRLTRALRRWLSH